jgi:hypothetical protein
LDAESKLILTWLVGSRDAGSAYEFMQDVAGRLVRNRVQLPTDGHKPYLNAVEDAFGADTDYAALQEDLRCRTYRREAVKIDLRLLIDVQPVAGVMGTGHAAEKSSDEATKGHI